MTTKYTIILLLFFLLPTIGTTQEKTKNNDYQNAFDEFSNSIKQDFDSFKSKNDSIFHSFLMQSWQTFRLFKDTIPSLPKPIIQPVTDTTTTTNIEITPIKRRTMLQDTGRQLILNGKPTVYKTKSTYVPVGAVTTTFSFYGLNIDIPKKAEPVLGYSSISNKDIALYFKNASNNDDIISTIFSLHENAVKNNLNGWGYLELLKSAAANMYNNTNNQVLFAWYALLASGYNAKVGYNNKDVFLLAAFDASIYYNSYSELNSTKYYMVLFENQKEKSAFITTYDSDYPIKLTNLSLYFHGLPKFKVITGIRNLIFNNQQIKLLYNANLTDYFSSYPNCDLAVYFQPPLSKIAISSLGSFLMPQMNNRTNVEKINFLLNFIQYAIDYETDEKQFGNEKYLFAEETLRYPYADCEDRSVLLSQLIDEYTGLKTIAIVYPGHVSLGVDIEGNIEGAYVEYKNSKYYIADPTYIGSKLGMIMPEFENVKPEIIIF